MNYSHRPHPSSESEVAVSREQATFSDSSDIDVSSGTEEGLSSAYQVEIKIYKKLFFVIFFQRILIFKKTIVNKPNLLSTSMLIDHEYGCSGISVTHIGRNSLFCSHKPEVNFSVSDRKVFSFIFITYLPLVLDV